VKVYSDGAGFFIIDSNGRKRLFDPGNQAVKAEYRPLVFDYTDADWEV